jgi:hypothetical protein
MPGKQHSFKGAKKSEAKSHDSKMAMHDRPRKQHGPNHPPTLGGPAVIVAIGKPVTKSVEKSAAKSKTHGSR